MTIDWNSVLMCVLSSVVGGLVTMPTAWYALKYQAKDADRKAEEALKKFNELLDDFERLERTQGIARLELDRRVTYAEAALQSTAQNIAQLQGAISSLQATMIAQFMSLSSQLAKES